MTSAASAGPDAPPPAESRSERFARRHPQLYALRHLAKGTGKAALALVGLALLINLLPAIPWPDIDLPEIPWPDIPWPEIPWPKIDLPAVPEWLRAILEAKKYWLPILIGIVLTVRELKKRGRERERRDSNPRPPA